MKLNPFLILICLLFVSCQGQQNEKIFIDASKIKEITITNKMSCTLQKLKSNSIKIKDEVQIKEIIDALSYSTKTKEGVNMSMAYGFFEIDFYEGNKNYYYTINYTVYDGVIIRNDLNGDRFKNDKLEGIIYPLFVEK
jgi:hypothetical protein